MAIPKKKLELDPTQLTVGKSLVIFKATGQDAQSKRLHLMRSVLMKECALRVDEVDAILLDEAGTRITMGVWMEAAKDVIPDEYIAGESLSAVLTGLFNWSEDEVMGVTLAELPEVQEMIRKAVEESRDKAVPPTSAAGSESGPAE